MHLERNWKRIRIHSSYACQLLLSITKVYPLLVSDMAHKKNVVYVSNLPYEATHDALEAAFEKEGYDVDHIELIRKGAGTRTKACGLAAVTLKEGTDREICCKRMDGKGCFGRPMIVRLDKFCGDDLAYAPKIQAAQ